MKVNTVWILKKKEKKIPNTIAQGFKKPPMSVSQPLPFLNGCM